MNNIDKLCIGADSSVKQALNAMDVAGKKILMIVSDQKELLGVITDGDIRRWILANGGLDQPVSRIYTKKPDVILDKDYSIDRAKEIMTSKTIECIPIIDQGRRLLDVVFWYDIFENLVPHFSQFLLPVVIMAGGHGTRLHPYTKILPKPLIPIGDKPISEIIIDRFYAFGCRDFYMSVNYKANMIKAYFNDLERDFEITFFQEEQPLGTAGSLYLLKGRIQQPFFVSNCDILINANYGSIYNFHKENGNKITLVVSLKHFVIPYGVIEIGNKSDLKAMKEKPEYDFFVNTGMYVVNPEVLNDIPDNKFLHITDLIESYMKNGEKIGVYPISEKSWMDMGQMEELQDMLQIFGVK